MIFNWKNIKVHNRWNRIWNENVRKYTALSLFSLPLYYERDTKKRKGSTVAVHFRSRFGFIVGGGVAPTQDLCFHSKTVFLVFKSDMIVVGMVFFGGGEEHAKKGVLAKKWAMNKIICFHSKTVLLVHIYNDT